MPIASVDNDDAEERNRRHVFVSYQRGDEKAAVEIASKIEEVGLPVFIDKRLRVGGYWEEDLEQALWNSFAVVVLWSPRSVASRWVKLEARFGVERKIYCPAKLMACDLPVSFSDIQCARLEGWGADQLMHPGWQDLLEAIGRLRMTPAVQFASEEARVCFEIAGRYRTGDRLPKNAELAFAWLHRALAAGHPRASAALSELRLEAD